jgi:small-conductance mechanosensitive channel
VATPSGASPALLTLISRAASDSLVCPTEPFAARSQFHPRRACRPFTTNEYQTLPKEFAMQPSLSAQWQQFSTSVAWLLIAVVGGQVVHFICYKLVQRFTRHKGTYVGEAITTHTSRAWRFVLLLASIHLVLPKLSIQDSHLPVIEHVLEIAYIIAIAWLAIGFTETVSDVLNLRVPGDTLEDVRARRTRTQVSLLRQIFVGLIIFTAIAAILMTFPSIRALGAGLFASAGLAGLALGMAARPTLGNLIAGMQIAVTEPIRIDDAVVVEGEFGRVAEVNTTYVIIRLWDLRHLVVPLSYFIEKPFQNWTRYSSDLIGTVFLQADYSLEVDQLRSEFHRVLEASPLWDRKTRALQVTDLKERTMEIRLIMSAANPSHAFDLRCLVRERLIAYLQQHHPSALPHLRTDVSLVNQRDRDDPLLANPRA